MRRGASSAGPQEQHQICRLPRRQRADHFRGTPALLGWIDDAGLFLDQWRELADRLGSQPGDVLDVQTGIIWHVQGGTIDAITRDHVIVCAGDGRQRRLRKAENRPPEQH